MGNVEAGCTVRHFVFFVIFVVKGYSCKCGEDFGIDVGGEAGCPFPREGPGAFQSARTQLAGQELVLQDFLDGDGELPGLVRGNREGGVAYDFRNGAGGGGDDGGPAGHGLKRGQAEPLAMRGKDEDVGAGQKQRQEAFGHPSREVNSVLHAMSLDGAEHLG